jgi:hypothetical protein
MSDVDFFLFFLFRSRIYFFFIIILDDVSSIKQVLLSFYSVLFRKCALERNKKREEDRVLLSFFSYMVVYLTEAEGEK